MNELKELKTKINNLKEHLNELIEKKGSLMYGEILAASKMLDVLLNEYDKLISGKLDDN